MASKAIKPIKQFAMTKGGGIVRVADKDGLNPSVCLAQRGRADGIWVVLEFAVLQS